MPTVPEILDAAAKIRHTWISNPTFSMGDLKLEDFMTAHTSIMTLESTIEEKRHELQELVDHRDAEAKALKDLSSRALSGFRAVYGPDSPQYDQAGGTRTSKRQTRRPAAAKPEPAES
jgi:hypothetical protein